ncbi:small integral membrane protein 14 [Vespa velutina]|uniref:small integral membrane protein 14 n=1 Tax=Vespa velutina TaxID=202808 RepID=UPI001FB326C4|nr:small integral membrane protein 14 [Vespa velutina]XP_047358463.1 small integral membrane protein 14 [Vespa velutina]XP_047358464.1 small integral membrane protein 14 [Vespa velutina]XP_047358465.1 small integral membrane protein 14 [Vespa velutina]XP_047358466.1 small integral membrane protein 14 [Vespa velutina]
MSDDSDLCKCIWPNDLLMQRLLSILRLTQNYCTDNECFSFSRLPGPPPVQPSSNFFMTCLFFAFIVLMYIIRPRSLRHASLRSNVAKNRNDISGSSDDPPTPPPTGN